MARPVILALGCLPLPCPFFGHLAHAESTPSAVLPSEPPAKTHPELEKIPRAAFLGVLWPDSHLRGIYDRHALGRCDLSRAGFGGTIDPKGWMRDSCGRFQTPPLPSSSARTEASPMELRDGVDANLIQAGLDKAASFGGPIAETLVTGRVNFSVPLLGSTSEQHTPAPAPRPETYVVLYEALPDAGDRLGETSSPPKRLASLSSDEEFSRDGQALALRTASLESQTKPASFAEGVRYRKRLVARPSQPLDEVEVDTLGNADPNEETGGLRTFLRSLGLPDGSFERLDGRLEKGTAEPDLTQTKLVLQESSRSLVFAEARPFRDSLSPSTIAYGFTIPLGEHDFGRVRFGLDGEPTLYRYEHSKEGRAFSVEYEDQNSSLKFEAAMSL